VDTRRLGNVTVSWVALQTRDGQSIQDHGEIIYHARSGYRDLRVLGGIIYLEPDSYGGYMSRSLSSLLYSKWQ